MIEFPFERRYSNKPGEVLKPYIPLQITGPNRSVNIRMLLDSGADISLIPYSVGDAIGLKPDLKNRREISGIGDGSISYIRNSEEIKPPISHPSLGNLCPFFNRRILNAA